MAITACNGARRLIVAATGDVVSQIAPRDDVMARVRSMISTVVSEQR